MEFSALLRAPLTPFAIKSLTAEFAEEKTRSVQGKNSVHVPAAYFHHWPLPLIRWRDKLRISRAFRPATVKCNCPATPRAKSPVQLYSLSIAQKTPGSCSDSQPSHA